NHDFDNGIDGLVRQLPHAKFPFISSNYDVNDTPLADHVLPHQGFERDGIRIGVFGLGIELEGLVHPRLYGQVKYSDPLSRSIEMGRMLKEESGCHLVVCLSHLGYSYDSNKISDVALAEQG